jgi:hypothetical protein
MEREPRLAVCLVALAVLLGCGDAKRSSDSLPIGGSAFSYIDQIKRRYVLVDEERGVVLPFALFEIPNGLTGSRTLHIAELFKVSGDQIMQIDAIMVNMPLGTPSGWE